MASLQTGALLLIPQHPAQPPFSPASRCCLAGLLVHLWGNREFCSVHLHPSPAASCCCASLAGRAHLCCDLHGLCLLCSTQKWEHLLKESLLFFHFFLFQTAPQYDRSTEAMVSHSSSEQEPPPLRHYSATASFLSMPVPDMSVIVLRDGCWRSATVTDACWNCVKIFAAKAKLANV